MSEEEARGPAARATESPAPAEDTRGGPASPPPAEALEPAQREAFERLMSASLLRLRARSPFFSTLALFARVKARPDIPAAATDGRFLYFNPEFMASLPKAQVDGIFVHELLHAALLHPMRRGPRGKTRWNIAADIVVNGVIAQQRYLDLPEGVIRDPGREHLKVEEIYETLPPEVDALDSRLQDLFEPTGEEGALGEGEAARVMAEWRDALRQATAVDQAARQGKGTAGIERLVERARPSLDWRALLWRFVVQTPSDFQGFDRRFFHQGLYLDHLESETVGLYVAIDTSGSVTASHLARFLAELRQIVAVYPQIEGKLFYADAGLEGPFTLGRGGDTPPPVGGGGTSFKPFFERLEQDRGQRIAAALYLTDGFGDFPEGPPGVPVLWVVSPGGRREDRFPFGRVVRMETDLDR